MNLDELRAQRQQLEPGTLPSGLDVVLGPVDLFDLVAQGKVPVELHPAIERTMGLAGKKANQQLTIKELADLANLAGIVALAAIKEPAGITSDDLSAEDKMAVFNHVAAKGNRQFGSFRPKQARNVEFAPALNGLQSEAVIVPGA